MQYRSGGFHFAEALAGNNLKQKVRRHAEI